jgi:hypothetical protein
MVKERFNSLNAYLHSLLGVVNMTERKNEAIGLERMRKFSKRYYGEKREQRIRELEEHFSRMIGYDIAIRREFRDGFIIQIEDIPLLSVILKPSNMSVYGVTAQTLETLKGIQREKNIHILRMRSKLFLLKFYLAKPEWRPKGFPQYENEDRLRRDVKDLEDSLAYFMELRAKGQLPSDRMTQRLPHGLPHGSKSPIWLDASGKRHIRKLTV